jgi:hypothetical protein
VTLKGPSGSENKTLKDPQGLLLQSTAAPLDRQGANGDWWSRDIGGLTTGRTHPPIVYGPKTAGTWDTTYKRVMPVAAPYVLDTKEVSTQGIGPVALGLTVVENIVITPAVNPFTGVRTFNGAVWASTGTAFYNTTRAGYCSAVVANMITAATSTPPPLTQLGVVKVQVLPSATDGTTAAVAVGSTHGDGAPYGYLAWADSAGRLCIGKFQSLVTTGATAYLTATATGIVSANRSIAFLRIGSLFQAFAFTNTGVLVANSTIQVIMDGSYDGAYASGSSVVVNKSQDARLSNFYGLV